MHPIRREAYLHRRTSKAAICAQYFDALVSGNGRAAAGLFTAEGVIDDLLGGHHSGRNAIRRFIDDRPLLHLIGATDTRVYGRHVNCYGVLDFGQGQRMNVRWVFTFDGTEIEHLCNSRVRALPEASDEEQW